MWVIRFMHGAIFILIIWKLNALYVTLETKLTTEATISKFGSGVLYSIRMKMAIIKSAMVKAFI